MPKPLTVWMDGLIGKGPGKRFRSVSAWAARAGMPSSTVHAIHDRGDGTLDNMARIARAAGWNPYDLMVLIGLWDEKLSEEDEGVRRFATALASVPEELRPIVVDSAVSLAERLREPAVQPVALRVLQAESRPASRS